MADDRIDASQRDVEMTENQLHCIEEEQDEEKKIGTATTRVRNATLDSNSSRLTGTTQCSTPPNELAYLPKSESTTSLSSFERTVQHRLTTPINRLRKMKYVAKVESYLHGPTPLLPRDQLIKPWFPRIEAFFDRILSPIYQRSFYLLPLFLIAWLLSFTFLVRLSYFTSATSAGAAQFIGGSASYWLKDDACGLGGVGCMPFDNSSESIRCPAQSLTIQLLNYWDVGATEVIYQPLVVGGFDDLSTYRADSWVCPSAIQQGLFSNGRGGCARVTQTGSFTGFVGGTANGVSSVGFNTGFPSSYRFDENVSQIGCQDLQHDITAFNAAMSFIFSFFLRPKPLVFFWVLFCLGYWQIALVTDPTSFPPDVGTAMQSFLPCLFVGYGIWRISFNYTLFTFKHAIAERTLWYLGGFWVGALFNLTTSWIPISQLRPSIIAARPGGLIAVIILGIFILLVVILQLRVIWRTGSLLKYIGYYAVGLVIVGLLAAIPGFEFRFHHYFAALALIPGTAFATRPSALFQGFLLGMFLDGVARWGFDSILQTAATLLGDGQSGSSLPSFITNSTNFVTDQSSVLWNTIPAALASQYDGFELLVDDVLAYSGAESNFTITSLAANLPHYFRIAYSQSGRSVDFTRAATAYISNGTWISAAPGAGG